MRKTKIICTLGPSTDDPKILEAMMDSGMDVARFNFSHGTHAEHKVRLELLKKLRKEKNLPVAALLDTKGPEIRLKTFAEGKVMLEAGQKFTLTAREVTGTKDICSVSYKNLAQDVHPGSQIMLDDGLISMKVLERTETDITCLVQNGGPIKDRKGVNVPGVHLSMPYMSAQDREDLLFGIQEGFDFVAASFCRSAQDVMEIRRLLDEHHSDMRIIAKLENQEGVNNVDEILAGADGVTEFTDIAVVGSRRGEVNEQITSPCGVCRQALFEFGGPELNVIMAKTPEDFVERSMDELLPFGFGPSNVAGNAAVEK